MTRTRTGPSEDPDSTGELVRDLEESGYPVDGSTGQFVPRPGGLSVESDRPELHPEQFDSAQTISTTPSENESTSRGEVDEQATLQNG
jgi:hypothetical protein